MLFITLGDPLSINIECLGSLLREQKSRRCILIGHLGQFRFQLEKFSIDLDFKVIERPVDAQMGLNFIAIAKSIVQKNPLLLSHQERGRIAFESLEQLKSYPLENCAILTGPIDKHVTQQAGFLFPGQTEYFASLAKVPSIMILAGPKLKVGLVTNHLAVSQISGHLNKELIITKFKLFRESLQKTCSIENPRIGITGLNPHCGDGGLFGREDIEVIVPAIKAIHQDLDDKTALIGPMPADTAFFRCYSGELDGILAMYHDQGLGPLKTVHFFDAVNITGGLPFLRVSPDHGPAVDRYGQGTADSQSFAEALQYCYRYLDGKNRPKNINSAGS